MVLIRGEELTLSGCRRSQTFHLEITESDPFSFGKCCSGPVPSDNDDDGRQRQKEKQPWKYFTAGRAKNEIAKTEKQDATIFPIQVRGTVSPYPMVVTVICTQQIGKLSQQV